MSSDLYGLVLVGGRSLRMGEDKCAIAYHGIPQWQYARSLLERPCARVFLSARGNQPFPAGTEVLVDRFEGGGPGDGLRTAFAAHPGRAWLVLACDLPGCDTDALEFLVQHRAKDHEATAFGTFERPEPLAAIWEPRAAGMFLTVATPPAAFLRQSKVNWLGTPNARWTQNLNTPSDRAHWPTADADRSPRPRSRDGGRSDLFAPNRSG